MVSQIMNAPKTLLFSGSSLASQVHAAAVNGHKSALLKQIAGKMFTLRMHPTPTLYLCIKQHHLLCVYLSNHTLSSIDMFKECYTRESRTQVVCFNDYI